MPCTVPSSPKGPCSTGKTTSIPGHPRPGLKLSSSPAARQTPSWPTSTSSTRGRPHAARRQPTPPRRARPRARTSGRRRAPQCGTGGSSCRRWRRGRRRRRGGRRLRARAAPGSRRHLSARRSEPGATPYVDRHDGALLDDAERCRELLDDQPDHGRVVGHLRDLVDVETDRIELGNGLVRVSPTTRGTFTVSGALATVSVITPFAEPAGPRRRRLAEHRVRRSPSCSSGR